ncbi:MAG TPA: serine hydrolase domain-containing protein [Caulobacteraceae bacterium]|nr:serine hydrolase domain-containing protein [Caulobacteraceae bacterium]
MTDSFDDIRDVIRAQLVEQALPSLAVAVVQDGRIVWEEALGWADRAQRRAADAHTPYSMASITKPLTATALMILARAGKIDLDRPMNDYLGPAKLNARIGDARAATVRRIADHSAGLPLHYQFFYADEPWKRPSMDETILRYGNLVTQPGLRHQYSNLGYGVLDHAIARAADCDYAEVMRREVFQPLGMSRSSIGVGPGLEPYAATRYGSDGAPIPDYVTDHPGASEAYVSAHDLARFALFQLKARLPDQKQLLPDAALDEMQRGAIPCGPGARYGIGFRDELRGAYRTVSHSGGMGGVSTMLRLFPDQGVATIVLCNASSLAPITVSERIAAQLFPDWPVLETAPPPAPPRFKPPRGLAGTWRGVLATYSGDKPAELTFHADGDVHARFGRQLTALVNNPRIEDGLFRGELRASIGTPDTSRFLNYVQLALTPARSRLTGAAIAIDQDRPRVRNALSHWIELSREG